MVPLSSRSKELLHDFQHMLQLFPYVVVPQLQPAKPHKPVSHKAEIAKYWGMQWDADLDHTPPTERETKAGAERLSEEHVLPARPLSEDKEIRCSHPAPV